MQLTPAIKALYDACLAMTGDPNAAATLVLAQVQSGQMGERQQSEFLSVKEAAKKYNLGERTVYRMIENGLPVTRAGRAVRIKPKDLTKWLADSETLLR